MVCGLAYATDRQPRLGLSDQAHGNHDQRVTQDLLAYLASYPGIRKLALT
jgi:hypothetical protein